MEASEYEVSDLLASLEPDPWRRTTPFSDDIQTCHQVLFDLSTSRTEKATALSDWLGSFQPCRFGRMEARQANRLPICILTENDLVKSDNEIRNVIERERVAWKRMALEGMTHGFLIVAVSERLAIARPSRVLCDLACKLCDLYLGATEPDKIHLDELLLRIELPNRVERRAWKVGANYFSSQADKRWWHDHRIPGGLAFSMNSVGHMARTRVELELARNPTLAGRAAQLPRDKLVFFALLNAMRTIGPHEVGSSRGTCLAEHGAFPEDLAPPPFAERPNYFGDLAAFSENRYRGLYHTDQTIPSIYFDEGLWRREDIEERDDLYFTYLHDKSDRDYLAMGLGIELETHRDHETAPNQSARGNSHDPN